MTFSTRSDIISLFMNLILEKYSYTLDMQKIITFLIRPIHTFRSLFTLLLACRIFDEIGAEMHDASRLLIIWRGDNVSYYSWRFFAIGPARRVTDYISIAALLSISLIALPDARFYHGVYARAFLVIYFQRDSDDDITPQTFDTHVLRCTRGKNTLWFLSYTPIPPKEPPSTDDYFRFERPKTSRITRHIELSIPQFDIFVEKFLCVLVLRR